MVSRSLTEVFVLMRNNAIHSRQLYTEQIDQVENNAERVHLIRTNTEEMESAMGMQREAPAPPPWVDSLEEAHYVITRLKTKLDELRACHEQQIQRPALDDGEEGEARGAAARAAAELGRLFAHAHNHLSAIRAQVRHGNKTEQKLGTNVVLALVTSLQELSVTFRMAQSNYLRTLTSREERSNAYFDLPNFEELSLNEDTDLLPGLTKNQTDLLFSLPSSSGFSKHFMEDEQNAENTYQKQMLNQKQMLLMEEENTKMVAEREEEVNKIVRSIVDLNDIFKDLGNMVHEQGTVLDRIDFNIEQTQVQVHEGYKQLQKADRYQRKNRKMKCILILGATVIILGILLIIVKT